MDRFDLSIRQRFAEVKRGPEDMHSYQRDFAVSFLRDNPFSGGFVGQDRLISNCNFRDPV